MENKDLIKDILNHLKDNEEARERFNKIFLLDLEEFSDYNSANLLDDYEKEHFLIHALSSPNGKPICGFLKKTHLIEDNQDLFAELSTKDENVISEGVGWIVINHARTLRKIYLDALDEGKSHDEAYKLINKEYNEIF